MDLFELKYEKDIGNSAQPDKDECFCALEKAESLPQLIKLTKKTLNKFGIGDFYTFDLMCPANFLAGVGTVSEQIAAGIKKNSFHTSDLVLRILTAPSETLPEPMFRSAVDNHVLAAQYFPPAYIRHLEFVHYLKAAGIHDIYYRPYLNCSQGASAFCIWSPGKKTSLAKAVSLLDSFIHDLAVEFDRVATRKFKSHFYGRKKLLLSQAERECLTSFGDKDLKAVELSEIRGVHEVTIFKQVSHAKKCLGVTTTSAAVLEALRNGLITIDGF